MNTFHIGTELRRFRYGKLPPLGLVVIILLPLIFGGLFVWSYFDPIGHLNKLPVALVNSDTGARVEDREVKAGDTIAENLLDDASVDFHLVNPEDARAGIASGKYYFGIELPTDFSEAAVSAASEHPHQATLNATFSNANGFMGVMLGNQVVIRVLDVVNEELGTQMLDTMLVGVGQLSEGLDTAATGAGQLAEGAHSAREGADKLADGGTALGDGASRLDDGARQIATGATKLNEGISAAKQGSDSLASGLGQLNSATDRLGAGAGEVSNGINKLVGTISNTLGVLAPANPLASDLERLRGGAAEIAHQLNDPNAEYRAGLNTATDGSRKLAAGLTELSDGSAQLVIGTRTLADNTSKLAAGAEQLTVGAQQLRDGLVRLDEGNGELSLKLSQGAEKAPRFDEESRRTTAATLARPVAEFITADDMTPFGVGLAPFFISLGLFVGGTTMFMLLHPLQRRAIDSLTTPLRAGLASYLPGMLVGWAQAVVMWLVLSFAIGLHPQHPFGLLAVMLLISSTFVAITQSINAFFGASVGRVLCIAVMALSLVSSGGLYPVETQPALQRSFHMIDPITYAVNVLRRMIVGSLDRGLDHRLGEGLVALVCFAVISLAVTSFSAWRDRLVKAKDLHPELVI